MLRKKSGVFLKQTQKNTNRREQKLKHLKGLHDQVKKYDEREKEIKREVIDPITSNQSLSGEERHIPVKTIKFLMVLIFNMIVMVMHISNYFQQKNVSRK